MKGFAESQSVGEVALGILLGKEERRPHEGIWGAEEGSTGIAHGGGNRGNPGKGLGWGKMSQGCPDREGAEDTPGWG